MLEIGMWKVGNLGSLHVVIDVLGHVTFAYLWSQETGFVSHVWLFNGQNVVSKEIEPPPQDEREILLGSYSVPNDLTEIKVAINREISECWISWQNQPRALLRTDEPVGFSTMVRSSNELAKAYGESSFPMPKS